MPNDDKIQRFVADLMEFRADEIFTLLDQERSDDHLMVLAAAAVDLAQPDIERIGVLTNSMETILIRIFHQQSTGDYHLYLLTEAGLNLQGAIVSSQNTFKYFMVDSENHAIIPDDAGVDLLRDTLLLTLPDASLHFTIADWGQFSEGITVTDEGLTLNLRFFDQKGRGTRLTSRPQFRCEIRTTEGVSVSKLLFQMGRLTRLVPLREGKASIPVPEVHLSAIDCYLYE